MRRGLTTEDHARAGPAAGSPSLLQPAFLPFVVAAAGAQEEPRAEDDDHDRDDGRRQQDRVHRRHRRHSYPNGTRAAKKWADRPMACRPERVTVAVIGVTNLDLLNWF